MRVNIYSQELLNQVIPVTKVVDTGKRYYGVRFPLASSPSLHHTPEDDDRSGITFWIPEGREFDRAALVQAFTDAATMINSLPESGEGMTPLFGSGSPGSEYTIGPDNVAYGPFERHHDDRSIS